MYEKRWTILIWSLAIILLVLMTMSVYPTLKKSFGESLKDVPESLQSVIGDASAYQTVEGFVDLQILAQMVFFTIILGVIVGTGLLAGEENEGTLQTLLAYPVSRSKIYIQKYLAAMAIVGVVCLALLVATLLGARLVGETMSLGRLTMACFMLWLVTMVFTTLGYSLGATTSRRAISGAAAGMLAFVTYLISALAPSVHFLRVPNYFSPFHYFNNPSILKQGLSLEHLGVLLTANLALVLIGYIVFMKRDVYQR